MEDFGGLLANRPHDAYFEQVFKIRAVALQLIKKFLPAEQLALLNLNTLALASDSFITEALREHLSDLVYTCETNESDVIRICLLLEHKSNSTGRMVYIQMGRYIHDIQEEDIRQNRQNFTLTIPILFFHGKERWRVKPLREQYGKVPELLAEYIPHFGIVFIDLQDINDDNIRSMKDALLLRNVLLTFKHARNNEFFRSNFREILIFVDESVSEEILMHLFIITLLYFQKVSTFKETEIMELVQTLPLKHEQKAKSTFDQIKDRHIKEGMEKGMEKGMEMGMEKGMEKMLRSFIQKYPDWTDVQIASFFDIKIEFVKQVRSAMNAS